MDSLSITREWAGWFYDDAINSDKIWAGAVSANGIYLAVWGRRGARYESQMKNLGTYGAGAELDRKIKEKRNKGYRDVRFGDPAAGNIPSFTGRAFEDNTPFDDITADSLLLRMQRLAARLAAPVARAAREPQFVEFTQLGMILDALVLVRALDAPQLAGLQTCYHALTATVTRALLA